MSVSQGDVSIGSIASSAGAEAVRQRRLQHQNHADTVVVSPKSETSSSVVQRESSRGHNHAAASEWRNVPGVVARSIVRMMDDVKSVDRKLELLLSQQQHRPSQLPSREQRRVVESAYSSERSHNASIASSYSPPSSVSTPPPPLVVVGEQGQQQQQQKQQQQRRVRIPPEAVIAQQQQAEAHFRQSQLLHHNNINSSSSTALPAAAATHRYAGSPKKQKKQQHEQRSSATSSVASSSYSAAVAHHNAPEHEASNKKTPSSPAPNNLFCVTTRHANSSMEPIDDMSLFGVQGPRGLYGTDQQSGDAFFAAHRPGFAELEVVVAQHLLARQRNNSPPPPQSSSSSSTSPKQQQQRKSSSPNRNSPTSWAQRIQAVRQRQHSPPPPPQQQQQQQQQEEGGAPSDPHQLQHQQLSPLSTEEEADRAQQQHDEAPLPLPPPPPHPAAQDDTASVASSTCSTAVVLASRPKMPDVMKAVREVEDDDDEDQDDDHQENQHQQSSPEGSGAAVPPLHPKTVQEMEQAKRSKKQKKKRQVEKDRQLQQRLERLREISQRYQQQQQRLPHPQDEEDDDDGEEDSCSQGGAIQAPSCRWHRCEEETQREQHQHAFVQCGAGGGALVHRVDRAERCQTCLDGISAATSMQLVRDADARRNRRAEEEELLLVAQESERRRKRVEEEEREKQEQLRQEEEKRRLRRQRIDESELRLASMWRRPVAEEKGDDEDGDAAATMEHDRDINQRILRAKHAALEQQRLLEQLRNSRWRREPCALDELLDAEAAAKRAEKEALTMKKQQEQRASTRPSFRSWIFRTTGEIITFAGSSSSPSSSSPTSVFSPPPAASAVFVPCGVREQDFALFRSNSNTSKQKQRGCVPLAEPSIPNPRSEAPIQLDPSSRSGSSSNSQTPFIIRWAGFSESAQQRASFVAVSPSSPSSSASGLIRLRVSLFSPRAELASARHAGVKTRNGVASWRARVRVNGELRLSMVVRPQETEQNEHEFDEQQQQQQQQQDENDNAESKLLRSLILSTQLNLDVFHGDIMSFELSKVAVAADVGSPKKKLYDTHLLDLHDILPEEKMLQNRKQQQQKQQLQKRIEVEKALSFARSSRNDDEEEECHQAETGLVRTPRGPRRSSSFFSASAASSSVSSEEQQQFCTEFENVWFLQFSSRDI